MFHCLRISFKWDVKRTLVYSTFNEIIIFNCFISLAFEHVRCTWQEILKKLRKYYTLPKYNKHDTYIILSPYQIYSLALAFLVFKKTLISTQLINDQEYNLFSIMRVHPFHYVLKKNETITFRHIEKEDGTIYINIIFS